MTVLTIPLSAIEVQSGFNARRNLGETDGTLAGLAASIRERGVLQPVIVRPAATEVRYLLVAGHRRCEAARMAGLTEVPVAVESSAETELADAATENLARRDLSIIERGQMFRALELAGWSQVRMSELLGVDRIGVARALRLLKLPEPVRQLNIEGRLAATHLLELMPLYDAGFPAGAIAELACRAAEKGATAGAIRIAVNGLLSGGEVLGRGIAAEATPPLRATVPPPRVGKPPRTTPAPARAAGSVMERQVQQLRQALRHCAAAAGAPDPAVACRRVIEIAREALGVEP